ncbi:conserved hypothetical protein [Enterococcus faecalis ATCC 4200]|nr:conserved hypothetical protein [Enterococcus faecalis ATCC 4200]
MIERGTLMSQSQTFHELYGRVSKKIMTSGDEWRQFLSFSSRQYKYSFPEKLMIYDQNPEATYLADFQLWNDLGRLIKKEESATILFEDQTDRFSVRQLFDYTQTYGTEIELPDWNISSEQIQTIISQFYEKTFSEPLPDNYWDVGFYDLVDHGIRYYSQKDTMNIIGKEQTSLFITESVNYVIGQKITSFQTISDDSIFENIRHYKAGIELNSIGTVVSEVSQKMLQHIYAIHQQLKKEEKQFHEQSINTTIESEEIRSASSGLRSDSERIPEREVPDPVHNVIDRRNLDGVPSRTSDRSNQPRDVIGGRDVAGEILSEDRESTSDRGSFESHSVISTRTSDYRSTDSNRQSIEEPVKKADDLHPLSFFDSNWNILQENEAVEKIEDAFYLIDENGLMEDKPILLVEVNPTISLYRYQDLEVEEDHFYEYDDWQRLDSGYSLVNHENTISLVDQAGNRIEGAVHLKLEEGTLFYRAIFTEELFENKEEERESSSVPKEDTSEEQPIDEVPLFVEENQTIEEFDSFSLFDFVFSDEPSANEEIVIKKEVGSNYYLDSSVQYSNGKKVKFKDNIQAIRVLYQLEAEEIPLDHTAQEQLAKYSGWGGLQEAFDDHNFSWQKEYQELKQLLTETEYEKARSSVLTAFYTSSEIVQEMYQVLNQIGNFANKTILDPGMGTGNFFMNLPESLRSSKQIGVEIDPLTSRIAKQLLPEAQIYQMGYEQVELPEKVDAVITNIPFNDIRVRDKKYDRYNFSIHDYFLAKSIDSLKENGILMVITSASSMDKRNDKAREYLAKKANLVGAVRLPKTAFRQSAGTEVISDILLFQKKSYGEMTQAYESPSWLESISHPEYPEIHMNHYFVEHPQYILGEITIKNFHGQTLDILAKEGQPLKEQLRNAFQAIVKDREFLQTSKPVKQRFVRPIIDDEVPKEVMIPNDSRKFTFLEIESVIVYHHTGGKYDLIPKGNRQQKIRAMIQVKEAVNDVITLQQTVYSQEEFTEKLEKMNIFYDRFVQRFGFFNVKENIRDLRMDDQYPLLRSIEKEEKDTFVKQPIFYKATIKPPTIISEVDSAFKALELSLAKTARVDFAFIQSIYPDHSLDEIINELKDQIFLNPQKVSSLGFEQSWEYCDEYLTGNVKEKLDVATLAASREKDDEFKKFYEKNVAALTLAQPAPLQAGDIDFKLGSPWIPLDYYNQFMYELLEIPEYRQGMGPGKVFIDYLDHNSSWRVVGAYRKSTDVLASKIFGTVRKNAYEIIEATLNLQQVKVNDKILDPETNKYKYVLNPEQTMIAREKQGEIEEVFKQWLFSDGERRTNLLKIYNEKFNNLVPRTYNGDSLVFDDMNLQMALRRHQKNVVARTLFSGSALMAHEVGAGKTAAMLSAGMYLKKNGIITKPLYVVPNHLTEQWGKEILTFYPSANILITTKKDFEKENRNQFVSRIATGDYDAVIIGHSQFERIPLSQERQEQMIRLQIREVTNIAIQLKENDGQRWSIKQMEKFKENLEDKLERLSNEEKKDNLLTFEQLGIDFLFVDEAHVYKNLFTYTKMQNVAGVGKSNSQRATDMLNKVRYIQEENDGKNVVFATGTPISNSMRELYVMQYFLQPEQLQQRGLTSFDSWAATFGQVVSSLEITPEANGYRIRDRFSKFHNLPELMNMFNLVADIQTADMLDLPIPKLKDGKVQTIVTRKTDFQEMMMEEFVVRSEKIRSGSVNPREDNMLKLTHEAKLMAIDSRLIDPAQPREPDSKLSTCCGIVFDIWKESVEKRSTQMIFSDAGTPKANEFNVYDEIKEQLIEKGIPENEIAFIHDAKTDLQKDTLFEKMRAGDIRVLLGSTQKVGTGTNVQNKLIAAHHIDCPWKPSDLTQREGRILRQGNENEEVAIYRYITKGTFDSYLWQIQEQKLTYISQVMTGKSISRSCEDLDETVLSASEVKAIATENPLLAEKMTVDNDVTRLKLLRSQWENQRSRLDQDLRITYPNKLARLNDLLEKYQEDKSVLNQHPISEFEMMIDGVHYTKRQEAFDEISAKYMLTASDHNGNASIEVGQFRGLAVFIEKSVTQDNLVLKGSSSYLVGFNIETGIGNIARLMNLPERVFEYVQLTKAEIQDTHQQISSSEKEITKTFSRQSELDVQVKRQRELTREIELATLRKDNGIQPVEQVQQKT